ncbi:uncharacterized protein LOC119079482 [Bradysia coprophila]|uniref:uncharacterized protein LOC119079482 n=1 Tax=Bradysia coprophila TaxID=38358 RepID=UPI00187D8884|nr:uncharacterized protein LOC119079482 [Bradysia coprophila]
MAMETFATPFPHGFIYGEYGVGVVPKSVDELDMIRLSISIREKPNWSDKMNDPIIVAKWKAEIADSMSQSDKKFDYVLAELSHYLSIKDGSIEVAAVDGTWQSDTLIDNELRKTFIEEVSDLENVPDSEKDWHPGSNNQVLDLVHPSLFCFVAGRTRVTSKPMPSFCPEKLLKFADSDEYLPLDDGLKFALEPTASLPGYTKSAKFQWLPSEFHVDESGGVKIDSYINNLHPECYTKLYQCIEKIFEKFVPMFNKVLTDLRNPRKNRVEINYDDTFEYGEERENEEAERIRKPVKLPHFEPPPAPEKIVKLNGRDLQVIVKLANIHLTPDQPEYPGGSWHIEGMANERIVASGIYYYSSNNITESRLNFRHAVREPDYEQYDHEGVDLIYKLQNEEGLNQFLGSIITKEGRCIVFPNTLQHQVAPFKLEDSTRDGHRKILVFFLVDPSVKILSTSQVPPQQKSWFKQSVESPDVRFPVELVHKIVGFMEWPMELDEAKRHRDELMNERKVFVDKSNQEYFERPFYLCEH